MSTQRSPTPSRNPGGFTTDWPYGPLADSGYGNPSFYHQFYDDFDNALGATGLYTVTAASGSVAHTAGDGGLALFTTGASAGNFAEIQLPAASFTLPQGTLAGKKLFWMGRLQLSDVTNSIMIAGLCNITTTPFSAVADGVYFQKPNSSATLNIISTIASTATTTAIPTSAYTLANATSIDLAFYIDWYGNLNVFVGSQLFGYQQESGGGPSTPVRGRCLQISGLSLSTANLSPTLAVSNGTAASAKTMTVDFHGAMKER